MSKRVRYIICCSSSRACIPDCHSLNTVCLTPSADFFCLLCIFMYSYSIPIPEFFDSIGCDPGRTRLSELLSRSSNTMKSGICKRFFPHAMSSREKPALTEIKSSMSRVPLVSAIARPSSFSSICTASTSALSAFSTLRYKWNWTAVVYSGTSAPASL